MKEISKTCQYSLIRGGAHSSSFMVVVVAEIVVEDDGDNVFFTMCWIDEVVDSILFEITENSIKKYLLNPDESMRELVEIRKTGISQCFEIIDEYNGVYKEQYYELLEMIKGKLIEEGLASTEDWTDQNKNDQDEVNGNDINEEEMDNDDEDSRWNDDDDDDWNEENDDDDDWNEDENDDDEWNDKDDVLEEIPEMAAYTLDKDRIDEEVEQLLDNYAVFNIEDDYQDIVEIFKMLQSKCPKKVTELWSSLVQKNYAKIVRGGEDPFTEFDYNFYIMEYFFAQLADESDDFKKLIPALLKDDWILPVLFKYTNVDQFPDEFLGDLILHEQYDKADSYIRLIRENRNYTSSEKVTVVPLVEIIDSMIWPFVIAMEAIEEEDKPKKRQHMLQLMIERIYRIIKFLQEKIDEEQVSKWKVKETLALSRLIKKVKDEIPDTELI